MTDAQKARICTNAILEDKYRRSLCCPRCIPAFWTECDVLQVTKAGYWVEYEIKVSRADFKADARKQVTAGRYSSRHRTAPLKHDLLRTGSTRGPNRFYYVTPLGLITPEELPEFAGLIEVNIDWDKRRRWPHPREVVKAPRLHTEKLDKKEVDRMMVGFYHRYMQQQLKKD